MDAPAPSDPQRDRTDVPPSAPSAPAGRPPVLPLVVGWLLPGAGHLVLARPWPALFVAAAIWPLFIGGMALSGFENVSWERHPWLFALQALAGLPTAVASLATRTLEPTEFHRFHGVGDTFTCVAGLLNLVALGDVWERATAGDPEDRLARKLALEAAAPSEGGPLGAQDLVAPDGDARAPEGPGA